jgi:hypothetical protein
MAEEARTYAYRLVYTDSQPTITVNVKSVGATMKLIPDANNSIENMKHFIEQFPDINRQLIINDVVEFKSANGSANFKVVPLKIVKNNINSRNSRTYSYQLISISYGQPTINVELDTLDEYEFMKTRIEDANISNIKMKKLIETIPEINRQLQEGDVIRFTTPELKYEDMSFKVVSATTITVNCQDLSGTVYPIQIASNELVGVLIYMLRDEAKIDRNLIVVCNIERDFNKNYNKNTFQMADYVVLNESLRLSNYNITDGTTVFFVVNKKEVSEPSTSQGAFSTHQEAVRPPFRSLAQQKIWIAIAKKVLAPEMITAGNMMWKRDLQVDKIKMALDDPAIIKMISADRVLSLDSFKQRIENMSVKGVCGPEKFLEIYTTQLTPNQESIKAEVQSRRKGGRRRSRRSRRSRKTRRACKSRR